MKFNPFEWKEISNETISVPRGRVRVMLSKPAALFVAQEGYEALAGVQACFDLELSQESRLRVPPEEGLQVFVAFRTQGAFSPRDAGDETFTNSDRMVQESGAVQEVRRAVRELELAKRQTIREIREAARQARSESVRVIEEDPSPAPKSKKQAPQDEPEGQSEDAET